MTISKSIIKKPRKQRTCAECGQNIEGETVRVYGCAEVGDPPFVLYFHQHCERPNTASSPTAPSVPAGGDTGDNRRGGLCPGR